MPDYEPYFTDRDGSVAYCYGVVNDEDPVEDAYADSPLIYTLRCGNGVVTFTPSELREFATDLIGLVTREENRV